MGRVGDVYMRMAHRDRRKEEDRLLWNRAIRKASRVSAEKFDTSVPQPAGTEHVILDLLRPTPKKARRK